MQLIATLVAGALVLISIALQRTYTALPAKELKRRARAGDDIAAGLYRAVGYGHSLGTILWFLIGVTSAVFFVIVSGTQPMGIALLVCALTIWVGFVYLPNREVSRISVWLAHLLAPAFAWILNYVHPVIDWVVHLVNRNRPVTIHTGLYEQNDLIDLLERQQVQADNRIDEFELDIARHALTFGDRVVRECLVPRRVVRSVSSDDVIGPILMAELHKSGHSRFPVYDGSKDNMVGVLFMRDLVHAKDGGHVKSVMRPGVCFVHEDASLADALQAILKTRQHLFIVVNSFEEYVGIITIEDVLEQVVGKPILDEFDQYDDLRAVAARHAEREHKTHQQKAPEVPTEVVEYDEHDTI